jgi:hypothetical protein
MPEVTSREFEMSDPSTLNIEERPALGDACKKSSGATINPPAIESVSAALPDHVRV